VVLCSHPQYLLTTRCFVKQRDNFTSLFFFFTFTASVRIKPSWRKLHNDELHGLYSSPNIVRVIKARRLRWAGHMARMGEG
jgi:hypothetical protein